MLEILQFVFSSFWTFIGTVILIILVFEGVECVVKSIRRPLRQK